MDQETLVIIVGAGPAGLATSACLNRLSIPNIVLEREDCHASLWKKRSYDRLKLHLAKEFCELPHMPYPSDFPTYIPRKSFVSYLDNYVQHFGITPRFFRLVVSTNFHDGKWHVEVKNMVSNVSEVYVGRFLVVATGENSEGLIPNVSGLNTFDGEFMHSSKFDNGKRFEGQNVLVVGSGNSGMEIAYDLSNWGANTSIVVRSPVHVLTKEIVHLGMRLQDYLPIKLVDAIVVILGNFLYGDISRYGLKTPRSGPFRLKVEHGSAPIIDVGTIGKIKAGEIKVLPCIRSIKGKTVVFEDDKVGQFDMIIFATGYKSTVKYWLKGGDDLFNKNGMPKRSFPDHWRGENGLYCVGFARRGLFGISMDARAITKDISAALGLSSPTLTTHHDKSA